MCVIIYKPAGKEVPEEHLVEAMRSNSMGVGIAAIVDGKVETFKGVTKWSEQEAIKLMALLKDREAVFHARVATSGYINWDNCHPFEIIKDQLYVMHNGVFTSLSDTKSRYSDSWHFAEQMKPFFNKYGLDLLKTDIFQGWAQLFCGWGNKLAFISTEGVVLINERAGVERDGIWYSNTSAFPYTKVSRSLLYSSAEEDEERQLILSELGHPNRRDRKSHKKNKHSKNPVAGVSPNSGDGVGAILDAAEAQEGGFRKMVETGTLGTHTYIPE